MRRIRVPVVLLALSTAGGHSPAFAAENGLGERPYLGWSSWSLCASGIPGYGLPWLSEANIKATSDALQQKLQPYGYTYLNIDSHWARGFDAHGRPAVDTDRFPSGIQALAEYVHAKGQKLGIYFEAGLSTAVYDGNYPILDTPFHTRDIAYRPLTKTNAWKRAYAIDWSHPGAQAYVDSIARQFASWGVDFLKLDGVTPNIPQAPQASATDNRGDVKAWSAALIKTGRPIWFTISWYANPAHGAYWRQYVNGMRANGDVEWSGHRQLVSWSEPYFGLRARWLDTTQTRRQWKTGPDTTMEQWLPYIGGGTWADMDSLDVGVGAMDGLSEEERRSYMTLWVILSSPLYSGDDLTKLDAFGLALLTNREVIAVNQAGLVPKARNAASRTPVWWSKNPDGSANVALFNLNDSPATVEVEFSDLGIRGEAAIRDLWARSDRGTLSSRYGAELAKHACQLVRIVPRARAAGRTKP